MVHFPARTHTHTLTREQIRNMFDIHHIFVCVCVYVTHIVALDISTHPGGRTVQSVCGVLNNPALRTTLRDGCRQRAFHHKVIYGLFRLTRTHRQMRTVALELPESKPRSSAGVALLCVGGKDSG